MSNDEKQLDMVPAAEISAPSFLQDISRHPSPALEAEALDALIKAGHSQKALARRLGISRAAIQQRLSLLTLQPDLYQALKDGRLMFSVGRDLAKLPMFTQQQLAALEDLPTAKEAAAMVRDYKMATVPTEPFDLGTGERRPDVVYTHPNYNNGDTAITVTLKLEIPITPDIYTQGLHRKLEVVTIEAARDVILRAIPVGQDTGVKPWDQLTPRAQRYRRAKAAAKREA